MRTFTRITTDAATNSGLALAAAQYSTRGMSQSKIPGFIQEIEATIANWVASTLQESGNLACLEPDGLTLHCQLDGHSEYIHDGPDWSVQASITDNQHRTTLASTIYFPAQGHKFLFNGQEKLIWVDSKTNALSIPLMSRESRFRRIYLHVPPRPEKDRPAGTVRPFSAPSTWEAGEFLTGASLANAVRKILLGQIHVIASEKTDNLASTLVAILMAAGLNVTQTNGQIWQPGSSLLCSSLPTIEHAEYVVVD